MPKLVIATPAKQDIQAAFQWWRDNRSAEQAVKWYRGIYRLIQTLQNQPEQFPNAPESDILPQGMRQLLFGVGRRSTHRIVFALADDVVTVLRVRHLSQDDLQPGDLT